MVAAPAGNQVVHTFCLMDSIPYLMPKILAEESCEVIVDASIDAHVQLKLQLAKVQLAAHQDAEDYFDSGLLDDLNLVTAADAKTHHQLTDVQVEMSD